MTEFAQKVHKTQSYVSQVETGKIDPTFEYIVACMEAFDLSRTDRPGFLIIALSSSKRMMVPLDKLSSFQRELLAALLLTDKHTFTHPTSWQQTKEWVEDFLKRLNENKPTHVTLGKSPP
jgi:transcriptional regulator with XRE-family HTH domain